MYTVLSEGFYFFAVDVVHHILEPPPPSPRPVGNTAFAATSLSLDDVSYIYSYFYYYCAYMTIIVCIIYYITYIIHTTTSLLLYDVLRSAATVFLSPRGRVAQILTTCQLSLDEIELSSTAVLHPTRIRSTYLYRVR